MENTITLSTLRISKTLAEKIDLFAQKEGISRTEIIRRALESYFEKEISPKPLTAEEILERLYARTGIVPPSKRSVKEVFDELYREEKL